MEPHRLQLPLLVNTGIQHSLEMLLLLQLCLHHGWVLLALVQSHQVLLPQPRSDLAQGQNEALHSLTSGEPLRKVCPDNPLSPSNGNLIGILQESPKLPQLLQLATPHPCSLCECLFPARRGFHGLPGSAARRSEANFWKLVLSFLQRFHQLKLIQQTLSPAEPY